MTRQVASGVPEPTYSEWSGRMLWIHVVGDRRPCLLAVHAHPDDETLTTGGTLARYAAEGVRTVVVTCTQGELGLPGDRSRKLAEAATVLGVARLVQLG